MEHITINNKICTGCGICIDSCPFGAIEIENGAAKITDGCRICGSCIESCPAGAIELIKENELKTDLSAWRSILVFAQQQGNGIHPITFEMIRLANDLASKQNEDIYCVAVGYGLDLKSLSGCGLKGIYRYYAPEYADFRCDCYSNAVCDCIEKLKPSVVLFGATYEARSVAPFVAVKFKTGLTADCTSIIINDKGDLVQIRPAFGGNIMARILTTRTRPQMATVRYRIIEPIVPGAGAMPEIIDVKLDRNHLKSGITICEKKYSQCTDDIMFQDILVAVGRGVQRKEDLQIFEQFAQLLGGQLASSRALVEKGWMPIERQIGLSGKAVRPKLLVTCGVSGSIQFRAGIVGAERIIAINKDSEADIFSVAHWSIVGDIYEIIPKLIDRLKRRIQ